MTLIIESSTPNNKSSQQQITAFDFKLNDAVYVSRPQQKQDQLEGVIQYLGSTRFAAGQWVGIRLTGSSAGSGDSDGIVCGERYFSCSKENSGIFVRPDRLTKRILTRLEELRLRRELLAPSMNMLNSTKKKKKRMREQQQQYKLSPNKNNNTPADRIKVLRERRAALMRDHSVVMGRNNNNNNNSPSSSIASSSIGLFSTAPHALANSTPSPQQQKERQQPPSTIHLHNNNNHDSNNNNNSNSNVTVSTDTTTDDDAVAIGNNNNNNGSSEEFLTMEETASSSPQTTATATTTPNKKQRQALRERILELEENVDTVHKRLEEVGNKLRSKEEETMALRHSLSDAEQNAYEYKTRTEVLENQLIDNISNETYQETTFHHHTRGLHASTGGSSSIDTAFKNELQDQIFKRMEDDLASSQQELERERKDKQNELLELEDVRRAISEMQQDVKSTLSSYTSRASSSSEAELKDSNKNDNSNSSSSLGHKESTITATGTTTTAAASTNSSASVLLRTQVISLQSQVTMLRVQFADIHRVYGTKTDQVLELQKSLSQAEYDAHKYKTRVLHLATVEMKQIMETKESEIQNQLLEMERLENSLREETIRREECTSELTELRQSIQEDKKQQQQQQQALLISSSSDDEDDDCNATDTIPGGPKEGLKNTFLDLKKQCKAHAAEAQEVLIEIKKKDSKSIPPSVDLHNEDGFETAFSTEDDNSSSFSFFSNSSSTNNNELEKKKIILLNDTITKLQDEKMDLQGNVHTLMRTIKELREDNSTEKKSNNYRFGRRIKLPSRLFRKRKKKQQQPE